MLDIKEIFMDDDINDWRTQAIVKLAEDTLFSLNGQYLPKGTNLNLVSIIQLTKKKQLTITIPSATALMLNCSARSWIEASEIRHSNRIDISTKAEQTFYTTEASFDYIERVMEAVITAFIGLEAFVNETIPDEYQYEKKRRSKIIVESMNKSQIERHLGIEEKISEVLPKALSVISPKNTPCWSNFKELKKLRDRIVHMKANDRRSSGPELPTLWHKIFNAKCPHSQVLTVMDHFFKLTKNKPNWRSDFPL